MSGATIGALAGFVLLAALALLGAQPVVVIIAAVGCLGMLGTEA